jgi:hypothetical protein
MRLRGVGLVVLLAALLACTRQTVLVDSSPGSSHPVVQTFDQHGLRFEYPGAWLRFDVAPPQPSQTGQPSPTVQPQLQSIDAVGLDELDNVTIVYGLSGLSTDDFGSWSEMTRQELDARVASHQVQLLSDPEEISIAGRPALRYAIRVPSGVGYNVDVTWVGFLRGSTQFIVTCTSLPEWAAEIKAGCERVLSTLHVVG